MSDLPQYAPLKVQPPAEVVAEMQEIAPALSSETIAMSEANFFAPPFELVSQTDLDRVSRGDYDINGRYVHDFRDLASAYGFSLTEVPGVKGTRNGLFMYRGTQRGKWVWRQQWMSHVAAIKAFVETLPFADIDIVRAIKLPPNGVHIPHMDVVDNRLTAAGHVTLTFVIVPGKKMKAMIGTKLVDLSAPAYFFQDNNPWGMVAGDDTVLMLKVCGWMDADKLQSLFS